MKKNRYTKQKGLKTEKIDDIIKNVIAVITAHNINTEKMSKINQSIQHHSIKQSMGQIEVSIYN